MIEDKTGQDPNTHHQDKIAEVNQVRKTTWIIYCSETDNLIIRVVSAGADGPAISVVKTLYYLAKNSETLTKLHQELDSALSPTDIVAPWDKVRILACLCACIDESMRLSPPVATDLVRLTPADRAIKVDSELVPASTIREIPVKCRIRRNAEFQSNHSTTFNHEQLHQKSSNRARSC